jgi:hypothetical protein
MPTIKPKKTDAIAKDRQAEWKVEGRASSVEGLAWTLIVDC